MEIQFTYEKKRYEFGRQCMFSEKGPDLIDNFLPKPKHLKQYLLRWKPAPAEQIHPHLDCKFLQGPRTSEHTMQFYTGRAQREHNASRVLQRSDEPRRRWLAQGSQYLRRGIDQAIQEESREGRELQPDDPASRQGKY